MTSTFLSLIGDACVVPRLRMTRPFIFASTTFRRCSGARDDTVTASWLRTTTRDTSRGSVVATQLDEYFSGSRRSFDLDISSQIGTPFQRRVWRELQNIPYGSTITYSELAARIARPTAVRAVGSANGANPLCIVIPCHRVIGSNGKLTGYGGGLERKRALLELEAKNN
ncbi:MAG TPA: methylated-DNA--[protein]-cysteine S-methyltransferase [Thermoanaerobaculia bacterium]|nr:methylated-DNA--[protein]-cysteine S-methyltransferase [Thermoanaerobaculia bacterium]